LEADLAAFGATAETVSRWTAAGRQARHLTILRSNWPAVRLFWALGTQWRQGPLSGLSGLDYGAIEPTARLMGVTVTPELFRQLQILEGAALTALEERRSRG